MTLQTQFETLLCELDGPVLVLTINRPKVLNAINEQVLDELTTLLSQLQSHSEVRVVVLTGAGEKAFVAGADISAMAQMTPEQALPLAAKGHRVGALLASLPQPVIAAVNGFALGGGMELALACDIIYASSRAKFGQPEVNIGVMPGFGGTQRLARKVPPGMAAELILGGDPIGAEEALRLGLVNVVCAPEELLDKAKTLAKKIASRAPLAVAASKKALHAAFELSLTDGNKLEQQLFSELFATADQKEGMGAFLAKRPAAYVGK